MRQILHDPAFERVEALWRGLYELITNIDHSEELTLHITQASRASVTSDLRAAADNLQNTEIYKRVYDDAVGGEPWSVIVADYQFGSNETDIAILGRLGAIAAQAGGILLTGGLPELTGADQPAALTDRSRWTAEDADSLEAWRTLRNAPISAWIGVCVPRVMVRAPYGRKTEKISSFTFEEQITPPDHQLFLWGNGALLCARLLAQSFAQAEGWRFNPNAHLSIDGLPMWTWEDQGQSEIQAVAEIEMGESNAAEITRRGLMALCSVRHQNACRLYEFVSAGASQPALNGPWTG
jgi:type VI secretion system protein ImpC